MRVPFGSKVKDKITNFTGIVIGFCTYITGCDQYLVQPQSKKNSSTKEKSYWIDDSRIDALNVKKIVLESKETKYTDGCDISAPKI